MLLGLGYVPEHSLPVLNHISDEKALAAFRAIKERAAYLCKTLPSQYDYLTSIYSPHEFDRALRMAPLGRRPHHLEPTDRSY